MQTPHTVPGDGARSQCITFMSVNERAASLLFDQSEAEKLAHEDDRDDEIFTVTSQGG